MTLTQTPLSHDTAVRQQKVVRPPSEATPSLRLALTQLHSVAPTGQAGQDREETRREYILPQKQQEIYQHGQFSDRWYLRVRGAIPSTSSEQHKNTRKNEKKAAENTHTPIKRLRCPPPTSSIYTHHSPEIWWAVIAVEAVPVCPPNRKVGFASIGPPFS